ncbi:uncharacterized protein J4E84_008899 [Alternaria hordeiaustralica]|uniref:uncharacterized protein n=1 Tax=Alternaria hordeiaustralica TaxID=1187925 RepID=UPI0020C1D281|nr:uncharacterized protein J4E84_008899 [Alternaria hordeiaustralica]KAI4677952.1 hypothetical protein J4E84_008899 [Alternaria hordeiaustralica]
MESKPPLPVSADSYVSTHSTALERASSQALVGDENPLNWSALRKWPLSIIVILMSATMGYYSGVHAASIQAVADFYGCSVLASTSAVSFFLLGFAIGPLFFAPLSEMLGRNPILRVAFGLFVISNIGDALAPNIETLLFFRFLGGLLGAPTVTNTAGSLTDMGYWTSMILGGITYICALLFLPETYAPQLVRAKQIKAGGNLSNVDWKKRARDNLVRPWVMLFTEPIVWALSTYMAFLYGIMCLVLVAYPIVYKEYRGWSTAKMSVGYTGLAMGMALPTILSPLLNRAHTHFVRKLGPQPEARFPLQIAFTWLTPIGLFWFAWTATASVPAVVPILAGVPLGIGLLTAFLDIAAYLTDCYGIYGASALAANGLLCRLFGAAFPLFSKRLYESLGVPWGTSLLAFVATAMAPIPWIFYRYGPTIRKKSAYHQAAMGRT